MLHGGREEVKMITVETKNMQLQTQKHGARKTLIMDTWEMPT